MKILMVSVVRFVNSANQVFTYFNNFREFIRQRYYQFIYLGIALMMLFHSWSAFKALGYDDGLGFYLRLIFSLIVGLGSLLTLLFLSLSLLEFYPKYKSKITLIGKPCISEKLGGNLKTNSSDIKKKNFRRKTGPKSAPTDYQLISLKYLLIQQSYKAEQITVKYGTEKAFFESIENLYPNFSVGGFKTQFSKFKNEAFETLIKGRAVIFTTLQEQEDFLEYPLAKQKLDSLISRYINSAKS